MCPSRNVVVERLVAAFHRSNDGEDRCRSSCRGCLLVRSERVVSSQVRRRGELGRRLNRKLRSVWIEETCRARRRASVRKCMRRRKMVV